MKTKYKINIYISIIIISFLLSCFLLNIISRKLLPTFKEYSVSEVKNISTKIINKAINNNVNNFNQEYITLSKNDYNEIQMIDFDPKVVNELLLSITKDVLTSLKTLETGSEYIPYERDNYNNGVIYEVPLLISSNNVFLGNLGPKIPVKLNVIGDVESNIKTDLKEYGINNVLVTISISVSTSLKVIMPFISENINIKTDIPISIKIIQGEIPEYYGGFFSRNSSILSIPTE